LEVALARRDAADEAGRVYSINAGTASVARIGSIAFSAVGVPTWRVYRFGRVLTYHAAAVALVVGA
jgi:hypothetical protein